MSNITENNLDKFIKSLVSDEELTTESMKHIEKLKFKPTDINSQIGRECLDQLTKSEAKAGNQSFSGLNNLKPKTTSSNSSSDKKNGK